MHLEAFSLGKDCHEVIVGNVFGILSQLESNAVTLLDSAPYSLIKSWIKGKYY
jgi:hypothetical protein